MTKTELWDMVNAKTFENMSKKLLQRGRVGSGTIAILYIKLLHVKHCLMTEKGQLLAVAQT